MLSKIIYGKYVVTDADTIIPSGALYIEDDKIIDIGKYGDISKKYNPHEIIGSTDYIVTPGFVNAHGHGKGATDFQRGDASCFKIASASFPPSEFRSSSSGGLFQNGDPTQRRYPWPISSHRNIGKGETG